MKKQVLNCYLFPKHRNIKHIWTILAILLLFVGKVYAQQVADLRVLEIEEGLNERVVNKVIRDKFGYFYLFQDQSIQRYDGSNFIQVNIDRIRDLKLSEIDKVRLNHDGLIIVSFLNRTDGLSIESSKLIAQKLKLAEDIYPIKQSQYFNGKSLKFHHAIGIIHAAQGALWVEKKGQVINLGTEINKQLHCIFIKQDLEGNFIVFFGKTQRISDLILVLTKEGELKDYSKVLKYSRNIKDIYTDQYDKSWAIASYNGLQILNFKGPGLKDYFVHPGISKSQFGNVITAINTNEDQILFTKESEGLYELLDSGNIIQHFKDSPSIFQLNQKMVFDQVSQNYVSYTYNYQGTSSINIFNRNLSHVGERHIPFSVRNLLVLKNSNILLCGFQDGMDSSLSGIIYKYNISDGTLNKVMDGIPSVYCIAYLNKENEYWIGTTEGIYICDQEFNIIRIIDTSKEEQGTQSFPSDIVTLYEKEHVILAGSKGAGFSVINKKNRILTTQISEKTGLSNNTIAGFIEDDHQRLWVSTFNGLNVLDSSFQIIQKFYEYHGLPNREFNTGACAKKTNGSLLFGTINGMVEIDPKTLLSWKKNTGLHLKNVWIKKNIQVENVPIKEEIIVQKNSYDSLILEFVFPDYFIHRFDNPMEHLSFDSLSLTGGVVNGNKVSFPKLPNKVYETTFTLNQNSNFQYPLRFELSPNYLVFWYISIIAGMLIAASFIMARLRYIFIRKNEVKFLNRKNEIAELELTALRSQMNPHFIFNALGSIQYFIQTQNTDKADSYLSDFALLIRHILDFSKSKFIKLSSEKKMLELYISLEKLRFEDKFDYEFKIDKGVKLSKFIPPMLIQPFVENAINHGLYNLRKRKAKLVIHFEFIHSNEYVFHIIDNGIGRKKAKKYARKGHISRGQEIVDSRVQVINDQNKIKLGIVTEDLLDGDQANGTAVHIRLNYLTLDIKNN